MTLAPERSDASPMTARSDGRQRLTVTLQFCGSDCTLILTGSLDADSVIALESQFEQLLIGRLDRVVLDVRGVSSLDQVGSASLGRLGELLAAGGPTSVSAEEWGSPGETHHAATVGPRPRRRPAATTDRPPDGAPVGYQPRSLPDRALQHAAHGRPGGDRERHRRHPVRGGVGFRDRWVSVFEVSVSAITLAMVFAVQHTQAREQAATQRKLDELLRALPGASQSLMMLEEAPTEALLDVEEIQRGVRSAVGLTPPAPVNPPTGQGCPASGGYRRRTRERFEGPCMKPRLLNREADQRAPLRVPARAAPAMSDDGHAGGRSVR